MVLSADDMGIKKGLLPFFCYECGGRIGWYDDIYSDITQFTYCEECARTK